MTDVIDLLTDIKSLLVAGIDVRNQGLLGVVWKEDPVRLGFAGGISQAIQNLDALAGTNFLSSGTPDGEVWRVEAIRASRVGASSGAIGIYIRSQDGVVVELEEGNTLSGEVMKWHGGLHLYTDDTVKAYYTGCNAGDDIYLSWFGHRAAVV